MGKARDVGDEKVRLGQIIVLTVLGGTRGLLDAQVERRGSRPVEATTCTRGAGAAQWL